MENIGANLRVSERIFGSNLMIRSRGNRTARRAIVAIALIARSTYVPLRSTDY